MSAVAAAAAGMVFLTSGSSLADAKRAAKVNARVEQQQQQNKATGAAAADSTGSFAEYTADEVAKHKTPNDRVWVTYKDGVYDITDFIGQVRQAARGH
jgi:sulfite oxidase